MSANKRVKEALNNLPAIKALKGFSWILYQLLHFAAWASHRIIFTFYYLLLG